MGRDTGLKSYRTTIFRRFPRTGVPDRFDSWSEYENYVKLLVDLHCIDDAKKIWWDVRPHPTFGTLEFRVCDVPTRPGDRGDARRAGAGDRRQAVPAARAESRLPALPPRADRREQMARRALRARRQADRLRQARRKCRCASWRSSCSEFVDDVVDELEAAARSSTCTPCCAKAPAPTGSWRSSGRPTIFAPSCSDIVERNAGGSRAGRSGCVTGHAGAPMKIGLLVRTRVQLSSGVHRARATSSGSRTASCGEW